MAYMGDICVNTGSYTGQDGQQKNRYEKIGAWFQDDQGRVSIKITMIPLLPPKKDGDSGFFANLFHKQDNGQRQAPPPQQQQQPPQQGWNQNQQGGYNQNQQQPPQQGQWNGGNQGNGGVPF